MVQRIQLLASSIVPTVDGTKMRFIFQFAFLHRASALLLAQEIGLV